MLPTFLSPSGEGVAGTPVQVPPPPRFVVPLLPIKRAYFSGNSNPASGLTSAQKSGNRYERKALDELSKDFTHHFQRSPILIFEDQRGESLCIPDGIIQLPGRVCVVEVKVQHMPESWWQLRRKYEPIVRWMFPGQDVVLLEICRLLDAGMPYPESYTYVEDLLGFLKEAKDGELGVFQWKL